MARIALGADAAVLAAVALALAAALALAGCTPPVVDDVPPHGQNPGDDDTGGDDDDDDAGDDDVGDDDTGSAGGFPEFFTHADDFFETHISSVPTIDEDSFVLSVTGLVEQPAEFTLAELDALPSSSVPFTLECIGNGAGGSAVSTATWEGFSLWDLLVSVGVHEDAVAVRYGAADGYFASHTLDQVRDEDVLGVLSMNGDPLPPRHGYPLRFVLPGYYGVKHPGWVTSVEVVDEQSLDFWENVGWDCAPPMDVDSRFFFPGNGAQVEAGVPFEVGGAAWGGTRIDKIEISADGGQLWQPAEIVQGGEHDHVWVFWQATMTLHGEGQMTLNARATDISGATQPEHDSDYFDGTNDWPSRVVFVTSGR